MVNATTAKLSSMHFHGWEKGSLVVSGEIGTKTKEQTMIYIKSLDNILYFGI